MKKDDGEEVGKRVEANGGIPGAGTGTEDQAGVADPSLAQPSNLLLITLNDLVGRRCDCGTALFVSQIR